MTDFTPEPGYDIEGRARPGIRTANALYLLAGGGLFLAGIVLGVIAHLKGGEMSGLEAILLTDALYYPLMMLLPCALVIRRRGAASVRLNDVSLSMTILSVFTALACFFLASCVTVFWAQLLSALGLSAGDSSVPVANTNDLLIAIFAAAVVPGIFEELLFRGVMLSAYERGGTRRAVFVTAILFALLHGSPYGFPAQFIMGLVLGAVVVSTNSLYAGFLVHTAYNAASIMAAYYLAGSGMSEGAAETVASVSGAALYASLAFDTLIALALVAYLLRVFRRHRGRLGITLAPKVPLKLAGGEIALLVLGLLVAAGLYATSIFTALGGLS